MNADGEQNDDQDYNQDKERLQKKLFEEARLQLDREQQGESEEE